MKLIKNALIYRASLPEAATLAEHLAEKPRKLPNLPQKMKPTRCIRRASLSCASLAEPASAPSSASS